MTTEQRRERKNATWRAADERRRAADPDYAARRLEQQYARRRERLATDPEYRKQYLFDRRLASARHRFGAQPISRFFHREIRAFYANCPAQYDVDHIEPMFTIQDGKAVACGLHVPWNLQYLTRADNLKKANSNAKLKAAAWRKPWG